MNANELADKLLENNAVSWGNCTYEQHDNDKHFKTEAATMLRQQQAEIEALKQILAYEGIGVSQEYLDECVADLRKAQEK
jgi:hypothetical protein